MPRYFEGDRAGNRIVATVTPGYSPNDIQKINETFRFFEDMVGRWGIAANQRAQGCLVRIGVGEESRLVSCPSDRTRRTMLRIAMAGIGVGVTPLTRIYQHVLEECGRLPDEVPQVMATINRIRENMGRSALSRGRGGTFHDVANTGAEFCNQANSFNGYWAGNLAGPGPSTFGMGGPAPNVSEPQPSVPNTGQRNASGNFYRATDTETPRVNVSKTLDHLEAVSRFNYVVTRATTCITLLRACLEISSSTQTWQQSLANYHENPSPENMRAYLRNARSMCAAMNTAILQMPVPVPFFTNVLDGADVFVEVLGTLLGERIVMVDDEIVRGERERCDTDERGAHGRARPDCRQQAPPPDPRDIPY